MQKLLKSILYLVFILGANMIYAQHNHDHSHDHNHAHHGHDHHEHNAGHKHDDSSHKHDIEYSDRVMYHIGNSNEIHLLGDVSIPLPCILWSKDQGLDMFMSSKFHHGHNIVEGYVMNHGMVRRISPGQSYDSNAHVSHFESTEDGQKYVVTDKGKYKLEMPSSLLNFTSWIDFSLSKNVVMMILAVFLLWWVFSRVAKGYKVNEGKAPKGIQAFFEPIIVFLRDEVAVPAIGHNWERYFPFITSLFFFILFLNLMGLIPIPGANITGSIGVTLVLAMFTFLVVTFSGNKHYWQHILWMPDVPVFVKPILSVIEFIGILVKPFTLMIRLFANITAGHIVILSLVGVIFLLGENGQNLLGALGGGVIAIPFVIGMNILEIFVAFLQAFIFALLSALYIGQAVEEHH